MRMVARTLPGKQSDVGRRLRALVVSALRYKGIATAAGQAPSVDAVGASQS
jgi:small conductance mechanosensitive channel